VVAECIEVGKTPELFVPLIVKFLSLAVAGKQPSEAWVPDRDIRPEVAGILTDRASYSLLVSDLDGAAWSPAFCRL
jgi:hypothetical protein